MKLRKIALISLTVLITLPSFGGNIAHGSIKAIKVYDLPNAKVTKIYFNSDATRKDEVACNGVAHITHSKHDEMVIKSMTSIALTGYVSGKKVRAFSVVNGSCEADLVSLQESYF